jgi:hypothetical protein
MSNPMKVLSIVFLEAGAGLSRTRPIRGGPRFLDLPRVFPSSRIFVRLGARVGRLVDGRTRPD